MQDQFGIIEKAAADEFVLDAFARPLAERFQVSPIAMRIRLENLGLLLRGPALMHLHQLSITLF